MFKLKRHQNSITDIVLVSILLTLNIFHIFSSVSAVEFGQVNVYCKGPMLQVESNLPTCKMQNIPFVLKLRILFENLRANTQVPWKSNLLSLPFTKLSTRYTLAKCL